MIYPQTLERLLSKLTTKQAIHVKVIFRLQGEASALLVARAYVNLNELRGKEQAA